MCSHNILKIQLYKQILQSQHQIKNKILKHEKPKQMLHLLWVCVIVTAPNNN
jgi:hypothetical protein